MTTKANRPEKLREIALESLPQTIQDAITVTRELRYKYLWVDAIYIVQDDEEDCAREVSAMSLVYSGASLTISAAKADNSKQGFLQQRDLVQSYGLVFELPCKLHREGGETHILLHENCVQNKILENIDSRGWTLQEHLLAKRLLRYGSNQIEWKCREQISYDGGCPVEERHTKAIRLENGQGKYDMINWEILVRDYSRRSLLKLSDKLPAFGAIVANFAKTMKWDSSDYYAGLWKSDIHMQLSWRRDLTEPSSMEKGSGTSGYMETSCPSWSWASLRDPIDFEPHHFRWGKGTLEGVECKIDPKISGYRYGEVKSARLTVRGYVQQVRWTGHLFRQATCDDTCESMTVLPISVVWDTFLKPPPGSYYCLEVRPVSSGICGIILNEIDGQRFQRVGYFEYRTGELKSKVLEQLVAEKMSSKFSWSHAGGTRTIIIV
ncbi:heterokaryon incompatibility protein-domain-containing protein [Leptodontidium sp. MPI-SDFR-AT-0119]|nr:heterokaryon incompatibility protein-domain-containing protein [Leptodontidium sp. MPI-SDFR-AT-0119]